jgi:hypothetical protein
MNMETLLKVGILTFLSVSALFVAGLFSLVMLSMYNLYKLGA